MSINKGSKIFEQFMEKNSDVPMLLMPDKLWKLIPHARVGFIKEEIERIKKTGDMEHLAKFVETILLDPSIAVLGGFGYELGPIVSMKSLDSTMNSVMSKAIMDRLAEGGDSAEFKEIIFQLYRELRDATDKTGDENVTAFDYYRERIFFGFAKAKFFVATRDPSQPFHQVDEISGIYAMKYIPSFRLRVKSSSTNGVWEFPDCVIGVRIVPTKVNDKKFNFSIDTNPAVIMPREYPYPFVFPMTNGICTGNFHGSTVEKRIIKMDIIMMIYYYLKAVEEIFLHGYNEIHSMANKRVGDSIFNKFRVMKNGRPLTVDEEIKDTASKMVEKLQSEYTEHQRIFNNFSSDDRL
jgi:hypothetical protein